MNRKEFLGLFLPSDGTWQKLGRALVWAFYLFCCCLAYRLFAGVPAKGWGVLGGVALALVALTVALSFLSLSVEDFFRRHGSPRFLAAITWAVGRVLPPLSFAALGALLHDLWLRKPEEAVIAVIVSLVIMAVGRFDRRRLS